MKFEIFLCLFTYVFAYLSVIYGLKSWIKDAKITASFLKALPALPVVSILVYNFVSDKAEQVLYIPYEVLVIAMSLALAIAMIMKINPAYLRNKQTSIRAAYLNSMFLLSSIILLYGYISNVIGNSIFNIMFLIGYGILVVVYFVLYRKDAFKVLVYPFFNTNAAELGIKKKHSNYLFMAIAVTAIALTVNFSKTVDVDQRTVAEKNMAKLEKIEGETFKWIAYVEDFHAKIYHCGAEWTGGYGSTKHESGRKVKKTDADFDKAYSKKCVIAHLRREVYPFIERYVTRELTEDQLIGTCLFIYNVGGGAFSGYNINGKRVGKPSEFLKAVNNGENPYKCATKMTGFRKSAGKLAKGLLKRHWVGGAKYCGILTTDNIMGLKPAFFYEEKDLGFYFQDGKAQKDGYYNPNFDDETVSLFLTRNEDTAHNTASILP